MQGRFGLRDHCLNKLGKGPLGMQCYVPSFKQLSRVVLKKKIFKYSSMYFYSSNLGPLSWGNLVSCGLNLIKVGKCSLGMATYQILSI